MRILCLHGNGTNSNILEMQSAPLRNELEEEHEYEFVEGAFAAPLSAKVEGIEALSSPNSKFYAFYNPKALSTLQDSIAMLDKYIITEGPFDAILGFSAGSVLAALYLREKVRNGEMIPIKCGIFLASATSAREEEYLGLTKERDVARINIPTAHIWGAQDDIAPMGGQDVSQMCDQAVCFTLVHDGGHEFPRKGYLTEATKVVQRVLQLTREHTS